MGDGAWNPQGPGNGAGDGQGSDLKGLSLHALQRSLAFLSPEGDRRVLSRGVTLTIRKPGRARPQLEAHHLEHQLHCTLQYILTAFCVLCLPLPQVCDLLPGQICSSHKQEPGALRGPRASAPELTLPWCGALLAPCTHGLGAPISRAPASEWPVPFSGSTNQLELSQGTNAFVVIRKSHPSLQAPSLEPTARVQVWGTGQSVACEAPFAPSLG